MTVAELILELQALDPNLRVVMPNDATADMVEVLRPGIDTVASVEEDFSLAYPDEAGAERVVRLFGRNSELIDAAHVADDD